MSNSQIAINQSGFYLGVNVAITPYIPVKDNSGNITGFASTQGGPANPVTITFDQPVSFVSVTGNQIVGFNNYVVVFDQSGNEITRAEFGLSLGANTINISVPNIYSVKLLAPALQPVTYTSVAFSPQNINPSVPTTTNTSFITIPFSIDIVELPQPETLNINLLLNIMPAIPAFADSVVSENILLDIEPIDVPLVQAFTSAIRKLTSDKVTSFFDDERVLKTVLNFGNDTQQLLTNWMLDPADVSNSTLLVKLYEPLSNNFTEKTQLWISREESPPILDALSVLSQQPAPTLVYLRAPNKNIKLSTQQGISVENVTLSQLFPSGSITPSGSSVSLTDSTLEQYYTTNLKGAELNIDYSSYNNFVSFGSAIGRLNAFKNKLLLLENYNATLTSQSIALSASLFSNPNAITSSAQYSFMSNVAQQRQDLLRSFDSYEKFLYYGSGSQYSSSFTADLDDTLYFHSIDNWPKISGSVISVASASNAALYNVSTVNFGSQLSDFSWIGKQTYIASQYDLYNRNSLVNNIPLYLYEDARSTDFINFLNLIGYQFDIIKSYVDNMTDIYSRESDPNIGLSKDLVWNVAQSFGVSLPNQFAIKDILSYLVGSGSLSPKIYKTLIAETWKRFLDNQIYIGKTKGTAASLTALLNTYGIRPELIRIREGAITSPLYTTSSFETYQELDNVVLFSTGSTVSLPFSTNGTGSGKLFKTFRLRFATTSPTQSALFSGDSSWAMKLNPIGPVSLQQGYISLVDSSQNIFISSSTFPLFDGDYYNVMIRSNASGAVNPSVLDMSIKKYSGNILSYFFTGSTTGSIVGSWITPNNIFIGSGSGLFGSGFTGYIDEFRGSGEYITDSVFDDFSKYPGLYYGNTTSSAQTQLYARLSFGIPENLGATSSLPNESPYITVNPGSPLTFFSASGFSNSTTFPYSMTKIYRTISRYAPSSGRQYSSNKVVIAPPAQYKYVTYNNGTQVPVLDSKQSIVSIGTKKDYVKNNNVVGFYMSLTDTINDSIMRSVGRIDVSSLIGDPRNLYKNSYPALDNLNKYYWLSYSYTFSLNTFIFFIKNLLGSLFSQAKDLVPARTKLLTGVVVEPHILNRPKIKWTPIKFTGADTKLNLYSQSLASNFNLPMQISSSSPANIITDYGTLTTTFEDVVTTASVAASYTDYGLEIQYFDGLSISSSNSTYAARPLRTASTKSLVASDVTYSDIIITSGSISITPSYDTYTFEVVYGDTTLLRGANKRLPASASLLPTTIYPFSNFIETNPGAFEYFTHPLGIVGLTTTTAIPYTTIAPTSSQGTWTVGNTYKRGDLVQQVNATGSSLIVAGNNKYFVCLTTQVAVPNSASSTGSIVNFVSYLPPSIDSAHWLPAQYQIVTTPRIVQAVSNGVGGISLVPYNVGNTPFTGFANNHYKFHKNNYTAWKNSRYRGCLNTVSTTLDGNPPVQIFSSTQPQLVVVTPGQPTAPIQGNTGNNGPILDVE